MLFNHGTTVPDVDAWAEAAGTSFAAPMVSGVASLVLGIAPNLDARATARAARVRPSRRSRAAATATRALRRRDRQRAGGGGGGARRRRPRQLQGLWWNAPAGSESGWGINFAHQGDTIFATWFTYDTSGQRVVARDDRAEVRPGGVHGHALSDARAGVQRGAVRVRAAVSNTAVGSGTLTFTDANNGTFAYTVQRR